MSKKSIPQAPSAKKAPSDSLTLADITVVWNDREREHIIPGEKVALALDMAWRRIGCGMGSWDIFTEIHDAVTQMKGLDQLMQFIAIAAGEEQVGWEALQGLQTILEDARLRFEMHLAGDRGKRFRVRTGQVSAATQAA